MSLVPTRFAPSPCTSQPCCTLELSVSSSHAGNLANRNDRWGIFRLTDPPGLKTILNCTQTGIFHPHTVSNVYTDAQKPGHVWELPGLEFQVVDLRGKS